MHAAVSVQSQLQVALGRHLELLPVLPTAVSKLMALRPRNESYFDEVVELVNGEPSFTVRLLAAANSVSSAPGSPVTSSRAAVARIGATSATQLMLASAVTHIFSPRDDWERGFWVHALRAALTARALAERLGGAELANDAYASGLLHDVGRFVMFQVSPEQLRKVDETGSQPFAELLSLERSVFGLSHAELGAVVAEQWRLPALLALVIREHHHPSAPALAERPRQLLALVKLADQVQAQLRPGAEPLTEAELERMARVVPAPLHFTGLELRLGLQAAKQETEHTLQLLGFGGLMEA